MINVTKLPHHTVVETIMGYINRVNRGESDGFTIGISLHQPPPYGYMVGTGAHKFNPKKLISDVIRSKVNEIVTNYRWDKNLYIGGCRNPDGEIIIEVSQWVLNESTAIYAGKRDNQNAIWDLHESKEIII